MLRRLYKKMPADMLAPRMGRTVKAIQKRAYCLGLQRPHYLDTPRYTVNPVTECWDWFGCVDEEGYAVKSRGVGETRYAYRQAYIAKYGDPPAGMVIDHLCRNRRCVNVDHLELVTVTENTRRGRAAKLNMKIAEEIRKDKNISASILAAKYGVHIGTIHKIRRGVRWL